MDVYKNKEYILYNLTSIYQLLNQLKTININHTFQVVDTFIKLI